MSEQNRRASREFLRAYFEVMDVPEDEDGMVHFIVEKFSKLRQRYSDLLARYQGRQYPDRSVLEDAVSLIDNVLSQQKDNEALVSRLLGKENDLEDNKEDLAGVEEFFNSQVDTFDRAVRFNQELEVDFEYISKDVEAKRALDAIRTIITLPEDGGYNYRRIPELNTLWIRSAPPMTGCWMRNGKNYSRWCVSASPRSVREETDAIGEALSRRRTITIAISRRGSLGQINWHFWTA